MENIINNHIYLEDEHELSETDFTKRDETKFYLERRRIKAYSNTIELGDINIETPLSFFVEKFYNKSMKSYIVHHQIYLDSNINDVNYIFLMKDDILITTNYEDEYHHNISEQIKSPQISPILYKIDYRQVKFFLLYCFCSGLKKQIMLN